MDSSVDIQEPEVDNPPQTPPDTTGDAKLKLLHSAVGQEYNLGSFDEFKQKIQDPEKRKMFYDAVGKKYNLGTYDEFQSKIGIGYNAVPENHIQHTELHDLRHLNELANQPVRQEVVDPQGGMTEGNLEDLTRNKRFRDQYNKAIADFSTQNGLDAKGTAQVLKDYPDEIRDQKIKDLSALYKNNPVAYSRLKDANDIRMGIAGSGSPDAVNDANAFNHLQESGNYQQLQDNIDLQQQLMRKHGLGQQYFEKLKSTQSPLINTLDPGLLHQYWNSDDHKLGLSDFQYAGLETERMFQPDKYQRDLAIIRENKGLDEGGKPLTEGQAKKGYEYDRGVENVLYNLERTGRSNTLQYIAQHKAATSDKLKELADQYRENISFAGQSEALRLQQEFHSLPLVDQNQQLDEGLDAITYSQSEDERRFPLNYNDHATRLVKDAMSSTGGYISPMAKTMVLGAGTQSDNTLRFIKNTAINLFGSGEMKARNEAENIGHQSLSELAGYGGSAYSLTEDPLLVGDKLTKKVQDVFDNDALSDTEKQVQATQLIKDNEDEIRINPKAGQQNITGKSVLFTAANTMGQILGIADQSLLMGGLLGDAAKAKQMASALIPMYTSTQNQLYEQALNRGDENPLLKSSLDATIISLASLINPDYKVVKGMIGAETGLGKAIAGVDEKAWNTVLSENSKIVDKMMAGTKATARQLGLANLQYGIIVPTAQYVVHKNILNEDPNLGDMLKDGLIQANISMAIPAIAHGIWGGFRAGDVNPSQKYAIVEAGSHAKENIDLIDSQLERGEITPDKAAQIKDIIKQTGDILKNTEWKKTDGSSMSEQEVSDAVYNQLRKKVLEQKLRNAPDPQKPVIEDKIHEVNQDIAALHTPEDQQHKVELNNLLTENLARIRENMPTFEQPVRDAVAQNRPEDVFREIASQALETTKKDGEEVSSRPLTEQIFGKELVKKAIELHEKGLTKEPAKEAIPETKNTENAIQEQSAGGVLQHPQEGVGGEGGKRRGVEPGQQGEVPPQEGGGPQAGEGGGEVPPQGQIEDALPFDKLPTGIAHHLQEIRAKAELNVLPPERGEGITIEQSIQRGKDLIESGVNPDQVSADFKKDNRLSSDDMSVVRAKYHELANETDKAYDQYGEGSPEANAAFTAERAWYNDAVKPMQTEWHKIGVSQQGVMDLNTGSITSFRRSFKEHNDIPMTPEQAEQAAKLVKENKDLSRQVKNLQDKLDKLHEGEPKTKSTYTDKAKKIADSFRNLKTAGFTFKDENGNDVPVQKMGVGWNELVELGAKAIEKTGEIADGVSAILDKVKEKDWYKGMSEADKGRFESELAGHFQKQMASEEKLAATQEDLAKHFAQKQPGKFTPEEASEVWKYLRERYLNKDMPFGDALKAAGTDIGLTRKEVLGAIATPKGAKEITMELYKKQYQQRKALEYAKRFIQTGNDTKAKKFWNALPSVFFNLKTYGHGTVGNITHAGPNIFRPSVWKAYWPNVIKSFALAYGNVGKYEKAIEGLMDRPRFDEWKRAGLAVDPKEAYDDYQVFGKKQSWLGSAGTKGFNGLKFMRYDLAENFLSRASDTERADPNLMTTIANLVNHATGHSEVKLTGASGKAIKVLTFAPGLEISRWQRMITDPAKALGTLVGLKNATPAEVARLKIVAGGAAERLVMYAAMLSANAGLLSSLNSKQKINLTDPTKSDFLRFKIGGKTIDVTGNVISPFRLLAGLVGQAYTSVHGMPQGDRTKPADKDQSTLSRELRYKLSPAASFTWDALTGQDAMGNILPWANITPGKGKYKMSWDEWLTQQSPIPVAAGAKVIYDGMRERGMSKPQVDDFFKAGLQFFIEGATGAKVTPDFSMEKEGGDTGGAATGGDFGDKMPSK